QYSTASEATGHTPRTNHQNLAVMSSVPSGRCARGTDRSTLTKIRVFVQSLVAMEKSAGRTFISHQSSAICHIDRTGMS
ncbi:MAG TPA: hypothetical protein VIR01_07300, partial [Pyrinomonadaceae bacterium]